MDKYTILIENGSVLIQRQYTTAVLAKGGKPVVWDTVESVSPVSKEQVPFADLFLLAELTCSDWCCGTPSYWRAVVLREGAFEYDAEADKLTILEETCSFRKPNGNGKFTVRAYTAEAAEFYEGFHYPNGTPACYVHRMF